MTRVKEEVQECAPDSTTETAPGLFQSLPRLGDQAGAFCPNPSVFPILFLD